MITFARLVLFDPSSCNLWVKFIIFCDAPVAQEEERGIPNPEAPGSNPGRGTNIGVGINIGFASDRGIKWLVRVERRGIYIAEAAGESKIRWFFVIKPVHIILFIATVFTTTFFGAIIAGANPLSSGIVKGFLFSVPVLFILGCHELGHIIALRRHGIGSSSPYFIPAPNLIGTFGAIMRVKEPIKTTSALVEVGAAGPIFGFLVAVPITLVGLKLSNIAEVQEGFLKFGSSLIFDALSRLVIGEVSEGKDVILHPLAFAGWIGFFVTALNLIPIGQTDGGHILFAISGRLHKLLSLLLAGALFAIGFIFWHGWIIWALVAIFLGFRHPPVVDEKRGRKEKILGALSLLIFVVTFIPAPIYT